MPLTRNTTNNTPQSAIPQHRYMTLQSIHLIKYIKQVM